MSDYVKIGGTFKKDTVIKPNKVQPCNEDSYDYKVDFNPSSFDKDSANEVL